MEKEAPISISEHNFILSCLEDGKRTDGRGIWDFRALKITFGEDPGQCEVQLGQSRVYVVVSSEIVEPYPDRPTEGFFLFNTEFSPMASPHFETGRPSDYAVELGRIIEKGLRDSRAVDTEALCIRVGEKVWAISCEIIILDHGGNLIDCAGIAAITALLHFRRPEVSFVGEEVIVHSLEERDPVPLSIHHIPICVTFCFFKDGELMVVDPSYKEERIMEGKMTLTLNIHREVCCLQKGGGTPIPIETLLKCTKVASVKVAEITSIIQNALTSKQKKSVSRLALERMSSENQASVSKKEQDTSNLPVEHKVPFKAIKEEEEIEKPTTDKKEKKEEDFAQTTNSMVIVPGGLVDESVPLVNLTNEKTDLTGLTPAQLDDEELSGIVVSDKTSDLVSITSGKKVDNKKSKKKKKKKKDKNEKGTAAKRKREEGEVEEGEDDDEEEEVHILTSDIQNATLESQEQPQPQQQQQQTTTKASKANTKSEKRKLNPPTDVIDLTLAIKKPKKRRGKKKGR